MKTSKVLIVAVLLLFIASAVWAEDGGKNKFLEIDQTLGGWTSSKATGVYSQTEVLPWIGNDAGDRNLGLGFILSLDYGWSRQSRAEWGYFAPGIEGGYWKNFDDRNFLLVKPRLYYRINRRSRFEDKPHEGFMPAAYVEFDHLFTPRDMMIIAADGQYFKKDSYWSIRGYWERVLSSDWKGKIGIGPTFHYQNEKTIGISPAATATFRDTIMFGVTVDTAKGGPFYGAFVTLMFNSDRMNPLNLFSKKGR